MTWKPLKSELHHWWPRTLAEHWCAADGMVSTIRPTGEVHRAPPGSFGAITNAHHMKIGGPWDGTFEPLFNKADAEIADFVRWLGTLSAPTFGPDSPMAGRIGPQHPPEERVHQMARITASLLARSPGIRNSIRLTVEHYREGLPNSDPQQVKTLIAMNQRGLYDAYRKRMESGGRWGILFSDEREFHAGDGFLHNFPASADGINSGKKLVLPLLPTAAIVFMLPMSHPSEPRLVTLRLSAGEVDTFNEITQVYAKDMLFFRDEKPQLTEGFSIGRHMMLKHHGHDWIDQLLDDLSQFNCWGANGAGGIGQERPFSSSLEGNRWFERFVSDSA